MYHVVPLIVEARGGIGRRAVRCLRPLSRPRRKRQEARARWHALLAFHPSNFRSHHLAHIVTAAVYTDAQHIGDGVYGLTQRAYDLTLADACAT